MTGSRLFFALKPDQVTAQEIRKVQQLIPSGAGRPVPLERLHATLLFLGAQEDENLPVILEAAASLQPPSCSVRLDDCGRFPRASVVWLAPSQVPRALGRFQQALSAGLSSAGIRFDTRPWKMHVTLYRNLRKLPVTMAFEPVVWPIRGFELMESVSSNNGLEYISRGRWSV